MKVLITTLCLLMATMVMALPVHNITQGTNHATIQDAIDAVTTQNGDVITVDPGSYLLTATIDITKSVQLFGAQYGVDPRPTFGSARVAGSVNESILDGQGAIGMILQILADDVTIDGFEVKSGTGDLIRTPSSSLQNSIMIQNNIIHDASGDEGVQLKYVAVSNIQFNYVYDTFGDGLNISDGSANCAISCNELRNISSENAAIYCYGSTFSLIEGNLIDGTNINDGIKLGDKGGDDEAVPNGGYIVGNVVHDTEQDGIAVYQSDVTVSCNEIYNSTSENGALYIGWSPNNVSINDNYIHNCGPGVGGLTTHAIRIGRGGNNPTNTLIYDNCLVDNESNGYDQTVSTSAWNNNYYSDYLTNPGYPGTYEISGGGNVDGSYSTIACDEVPCEPVACMIQGECVPEDAIFDAATDIGLSLCIQLCPDFSSFIQVYGVPEPLYPIVTKRLGCTDPCNDPCDPATYIQEFLGGDWQWDGSGMSWLEIRGDGCVCITLDDILPVELIGFNAVAGDGIVTLSWTTASETDNDYFDIERDGITVGRVEAGNSANGGSYHWTDSDLDNGHSYNYSLIAVSMSGVAEVIATASATPTASNATVTEYALHQNYPNPFNPETNITFDLAESGNVTLSVYNALGQTVATLVNGSMPEGRHSVNFEAASRPSGLYFYRLEAGDFSAIRKMVLMK